MMGGIEILFAAVVFIFAAIGLIRSSPKELGVTMAVIVMLAIFAQVNSMFGPGQLPAQVNSILAGVGLGSADAMRQKMMVLFLFSGALILTAFLAYHGQETLAFQFQPPSGLVGAVLGWLVGAFNGYLIAGTIWYYLDLLGYPIQIYAWFTPTFTELAQNLIKLLPQNVAGGFVMSGLALALLWMRILK
jgi:hypothetical protein